MVRHNYQWPKLRRHDRRPWIMIGTLCQTYELSKISKNQVAKRLEQQCRPPSKTVSSGDPPCKEPESDLRSIPPPLRVVFACRQDVDPPLLIAHISQLVAACNARQCVSDLDMILKLVPLLKGSEMALALATRLRQVAVCALEVRCLRYSFHFLRIYLSLSKRETRRRPLPLIPPRICPRHNLTMANWLPYCSLSMQKQRQTARNPDKHVQTHIKQQRTPAPKDLRAA